jgi:dimeric dUTPase (all-alpha-NTP-PPase superfamily)
MIKIGTEKHWFEITPSGVEYVLCEYKHGIHLNRKTGEKKESTTLVNKYFTNLECAFSRVYRQIVKNQITSDTVQSTKELLDIFKQSLEVVKNLKHEVK